MPLLAQILNSTTPEKMRSERADLSDRVTHLLPPGSDAEAADTLYKIACEERLKGSTRAINGKTHVICFSEAPKNEFTKERRHFSSFGISVDKYWLFATGGRPVIYQPREENQYIDPTLHWKIVSFDPIKPPAEGWVDWSWQREWRIPSESLYLPPEKAIFLVPSEEQKQQLLARYQADEEERALFEELVLCLYPNPPRDFPYPIEVIPST